MAFPGQPESTKKTGFIFLSSENGDPSHRSIKQQLCLFLLLLLPITLRKLYTEKALGNCGSDFNFSYQL